MGGYPNFSPGSHPRALEEWWMFVRWERTHPGRRDHWRVSVNPLQMQICPIFGHFSHIPSLFPVLRASFECGEQLSYQTDVMYMADYTANNLHTVWFLEVQMKCQERDISRLLTWVLFYSDSLLFKLRGKTQKCNIHFFYIPFIYSPMETWLKSRHLSWRGGSIDYRRWIIRRVCWLLCRKQWALCVDLSIWWEKQQNKLSCLLRYCMCGQCQRGKKGLRREKWRWRIIILSHRRGRIFKSQIRQILIFQNSLILALMRVFF